MTTTASIKTINAALSLLCKLTAPDILAMHNKAVASAKEPPPDSVFPLESDEDILEIRRAMKNEKQRAFRATPEGREYANEASRKTAASKKHAEAVKALILERVEAQRNKNIKP